MLAPVQIGSLTLTTPLVNGSGVVDVVAASEEWNLPPAQLRSLGAFVTKSITAEPRAGHPQPWAVSAFGPDTVVNSAGLPNPGIDAAMREWSTIPDQLSRPVIVSVSAVDPAQLRALASAIELASWASAIEVNCACPNVACAPLAHAPREWEALAQSLAATVRLPVIYKLAPANAQPADTARALEAGGAAALTCGNGMPVRVSGAARGDQPQLGAGPDASMSGAMLHPINLRLTSQVADAVAVPVIGLGGIISMQAARDYVDAGARVLSIGIGAHLVHGLLEELSSVLAAGVTPAVTPGGHAVS